MCFAFPSSSFALSLRRPERYPDPAPRLWPLRPRLRREHDRAVVSGARVLAEQLEAQRPADDPPPIPADCGGTQDLAREGEDVALDLQLAAVRDRIPAVEERVGPGSQRQGPQTPRHVGIHRVEG